MMWVRHLTAGAINCCKAVVAETKGDRNWCRTVHRGWSMTWESLQWWLRSRACW